RNMPLSERSSAYTARNCCTESNFTPTSRSTGARGCRRRSSSPGDRRGLPSGGVSRAALASALVGAESPRPTWGKAAGPARPAMGGGVEGAARDAGEDAAPRHARAGGPVQGRPARHVHVDVLDGEHHALLLLQHRGEQGDPAAAAADGGASRRAATGGGRDQRLHLD